MSDKDEYYGEFKNDLMHGIGKITYKSSGQSYEGLFFEGKRSNIGRVYFSDEN